VGHYGALVHALDGKNIRAALVDAISRGVPFLGICLGLQVLFQSSEEAPLLQGLNLLPGSVCALPASVKLPHMGWNQVVRQKESRLLEGISADTFFYFAHSFAVLDSMVVPAATCTYGSEFAAVIEHKNISGVQFHPEKSGPAGARVLENFLRIAA
jgi:imidazole glycerol phosphate synthase glutamine amidotransferase subunit